MSLENQMWPGALVSDDATIQDVIQNLDRTGLQISLVVNQDGALLGTVTDGDIRRALLRGQSLQSPVRGIMFEAPLVVPPEMARDVVLHLMRANKIHQLPMVDDQRRVVGLHVWDDIIAPRSRPNTMIIMAGGFGRRLGSLTADCPKPMLPVAGKPMLEHIVEKAINQGFGSFVFSVHYMPHVIKDHFGDGAKWGVHIAYLNEEAPLGTAGAIALLDPAPTMPFIVTNGDVLTDIHYGDLLDFHSLHKADATMAIRLHEWQHPFGVVHTDGISIVRFEEKPLHRTNVNAGIYALSPEVIRFLRRGEPCDMPTVFERLKAAGKRTIAYPMHEPWLDVGRPEDLQLANRGKD